MCTLIAVHRQIPGRPLVVAANRDEYLDRPAEGPAIRQTRVGRVLAPLDLRAGGTWLGLSERGVFAALTNLRADDPDPQRRSRGEVVLDALGADSAGAAARQLAELEAEAYNPFNLFVADEHTAHVIVYRDRPDAQELPAGVHVIGNVEATGPGNPKVSRIREEVESAIAGSGAHDGDRPGARKDLLDRLATVCRHHGNRSGGESEARQRSQDESQEGKDGQGGQAARTGQGNESVPDRPGTTDTQEGSNRNVRIENREPLGDTCVHLGGTYGTRSSLLLELGEGFRTGRLLHANGPPCEAIYEDVSSLLIELGRRPAVDTAESLMRTAS